MSSLLKTETNNPDKGSAAELSPKPKIIVIVGPTASGKSDLAVKLAKRFNGEVISADSRQVYRGLDLGSGKVPRDPHTPKSSKLSTTSYWHAGVPHHLLDVASPKTVFTVQKYQRLTSVAIAGILRRKKLPIICGGTGLYIDSVIYGTQFPKVPPNRKLRAKLEALETSQLFELLKKLDIRRSNNIERHNRRRLIRAIEIAKMTGKPIPSFTRLSSSDLGGPYEVLKIGLNPPKEKLKKRIEKRLEKRLRLGMVKEVENLHKHGLSWKRLDDLGLEYRYISRYLRGLLTYEQMKQEILKESWQYAKRQMTWFKRDPEINWIKP